MSSEVVAPVAATESKKKARKPAVKKAAPEVAPSGAGPVAKKARRARFNPYVPTSFLNLPELWNYRESKRRCLKKMEDRVAASTDEAQKKKLQQTVNRYRAELQQSDENQREVYDNVRLLLEVSRAGVKLDSTVSDFLRQSGSALADSLNTKEAAPVAADASADA